MKAKLEQIAEIDQALVDQLPNFKIKMNQTDRFTATLTLLFESFVDFATIQKLKSIKPKIDGVKIQLINSWENVDQNQLALFWNQAVADCSLKINSNLETIHSVSFSEASFSFKTDDLNFVQQVNAAKEQLLKTLLDWSINTNTIDIEYIDNSSAYLLENQERTQKELIAQQQKLETIKAQQEAQTKAINDYKYTNSIHNAMNPIPLNDVTEEMKQVWVQGQVFHVEKESRRNGFIYRFRILDDTNTLEIFEFALNENPEREKIKKNDWIVALITILPTRNDGVKQNFVGKINKLLLKPQQIDQAFFSPRIEFNFHTKMSALDSIIEPKDLIDFATKNNLKTIGITDRNVVQAYPEIFTYLNKTKSDLKIIYGIETEEIPSYIELVLNPCDQNLNNATYVVFDIETTGLFPNYDGVIEIGAIKIKNNELLGRLSFFLKPNKEISLATQELTNITNSDIADAISEKEGLIKIFEFFKDSVLVAHNAINFDINFLNIRAVHHNLEPLNNPVIDTLMISRAINKDFKSHRLGWVCKKYGIDYNEDSAHRADYDAEVLNQVFKVMLDKLFHEYSITNLNEINDKLQNDTLRSRIFGKWLNLYVKKQENIRDMYELVSLSHTDNFFSRPTLYREQIEKKRENGLLTTNAVHESDLIEALFSKTDQEIKSIIQSYDFITLPSLKTQAHLTYEQNKISLEDLKHAFVKLVSFSYELNKKVVYSNTPYFLDADHKKFYDVYVHSKQLEGKSHRFSHEKYVPDLYLDDAKAAEFELSYLNNETWINDIIYNHPQAIVDLIDDSIAPLKSGLYAPKIEGVNEKAKAYIYETAHRIYGDHLHPIIQKRLDREWNAISEHGFTVVYWISHLLVKKSLEDGYGVGSRGSVGSSLVATFLDITDVNPLPPHYLCTKCKYCEFVEDADDGFDLVPKNCSNCDLTLTTNGHNIPFETFLGFNADKVPDIDLNFSGLYQQTAHNFIMEYFGSSHAFRAGTIATVAEKTAFGMVRKYFEEQKLDPKVRDSTIMLYALACINSKRTTGQHPGGIIVVPEDLSIFDFSPYNYPANKKEENWLTTHFAFEYLHDNLLKFDILGHDNPTILNLIKKLTNIDDRDVPMYDLKVIASFSDISVFNLEPRDVLNETTGAISIPEFGTKFVRQMLVDTKPKSFADLIRISGLSHGTDVWLDNAQSLIKSGKVLKDVIACRDDIMTYLIALNIEPSIAFAVMEDVRKGKKIKLDHQKILQEKQIPQWYIESANKIKYMFPKAHATAYVMHAYKFAWFKLYYPLEYYAAFLSVRAEKVDMLIIKKGKLAIEEEYKRIVDKENKAKNGNGPKPTTAELESLNTYEIMVELLARGIKINNVDIKKSAATDFLIDRSTNSIIPPFTMLPGLGEIVANSIVSARDELQFATIEDLKARTKLSKKDLDNLSKIGALDELSETDQLTLF
ncbi:DNA polymerase III subunit alpha [Ureaplasma diversum]|uniref:DNA polymerase III PolC-type n=1 Tax=Ureaplasma diversum NCTC 246 TaxID=1188241 RepID=A0A084EW97_9BACT|nr:DNA polymerase III subunit alpha [Ureaplasma diversum]KEZ22239.1 DNA polymerase III, alpha chain [Ureaplasma diversum NCTC 246]